jgi:hypothetical protein
MQSDSSSNSGHSREWLRAWLRELRSRENLPLQLQIDHCALDIQVIDESGRRVIRPYLFLLLESSSRQIFRISL